MCDQPAYLMRTASYILSKLLHFYIFYLYLSHYLFDRWIQQAIYRSIAYHSRTIRLPAHVHSHVNLVRRSKTHLQTILERTPTHEEVAKEINMPTEKYIKMQHLTLAALSLDIPKYRAQKDGSSSDLQLIDTMHRLGDYAKNEPTPEKKFENSLFHKDLKEMYKVRKIIFESL